MASREFDNNCINCNDRDLSENDQECKECLEKCTGSWFPNWKPEQ